MTNSQTEKYPTRLSVAYCFSQWRFLGCRWLFSYLILLLRLCINKRAMAGWLWTMMNWEEYGRSSCGLFYSIILALTWRSRKKPQNVSVRITGVMTETWTRYHLTEIRHTRCCVIINYKTFEPLLIFWSPVCYKGKTLWMWRKSALIMVLPTLKFT